jgi:hypothetical protein
MNNKESIINNILDEMFAQKVPSITEARRDDLHSFMNIVINGDELDTTYLIISASVTNEEEGVLVYLISETRLLKFDITSKEVSSSFKLNDISSITYSREKEKRSINVSIKGSKGFGLQYDKSDATKIETFFQKLDDLRAKKNGR